MINLNDVKQLKVSVDYSDYEKMCEQLDLKIEIIDFIEEMKESIKNNKI